MWWVSGLTKALHRTLYMRIVVVLCHSPSRTLSDTAVVTGELFYSDITTFSTREGKFCHKDRRVCTSDSYYDFDRRNVYMYPGLMT